MCCEWTFTRNVVCSVSIGTAWTRDGPLVAEVVIITGTLSILTRYIYPEEGYFLLDPDEELTERRNRVDSRDGKLQSLLFITPSITSSITPSITYR